MHRTVSTAISILIDNTESVNQAVSGLLDRDDKLSVLGIPWNNLKSGLQQVQLFFQASGMKFCLYFLGVPELVLPLVVFDQ